MSTVRIGCISAEPAGDYYRSPCQHQRCATPALPNPRAVQSGHLIQHQIYFGHRCRRYAASSVLPRSTRSFEIGYNMRFCVKLTSCSSTASKNANCTRF